MRSRMPAAAYLSHEWFARERELLFRKLWLFAGLKTMLGAHNSFVTREVCGVPVVLQNFNGELRAFENICLHRGAKLQWERAGRRPLLCRYHGWGYDQTGAPAHDHAAPSIRNYCVKWRVRPAGTESSQQRTPCGLRLGAIKFGVGIGGQRLVDTWHEVHGLCKALRVHKSRMVGVAQVFVGEFPVESPGPGGCHHLAVE